MEPSKGGGQPHGPASANGRRRGLARLIAAGATALVLAASVGLAAGSPPLLPSAARVTASVANPVVGQTAILSVAYPRRAAYRYSWFIDGERASGAQGSILTKRFGRPGTKQIVVRVSNQGRVVSEGTLVVDVRKRGLSTSALIGGRIAPTPPRQSVEHARDHLAGARARSPLRESRVLDRSAPRASVAAAATVTIRDFNFNASALSIKVGDTVTWVNGGPSTHTATANNGSFNTGPLAKGASGAHTFSQAGTYTYFCSIHPFMHGTITVASAAPSAGASPGGGASSNNSSPPSSSSGAASSGQSTGSSLPLTGLDLTPVVLAAVLLLGIGALLRRRLR